MFWLWAILGAYLYCGVICNCVWLYNGKPWKRPRSEVGIWELGTAISVFIWPALVWRDISK
jgi:hypothetical protein